MTSELAGPNWQPSQVIIKEQQKVSQLVETFKGNKTKVFCADLFNSDFDF